MKMNAFNPLAPCMAMAMAMAMLASSAHCQEVAHVSSESVESGTYVGDTSCSSCGSVVSDDGGLLHGRCPNCGGALGSLGGHFGLGRGRTVESTIQERSYGQPDLFYNYYTEGLANRANAQMYLSPVPVPPNVGHTFYTYQPFLPHHMLYPHVDKYHRYYDGGRGMNRTRASYWTSAHARTKNFYWNFLRIPR